MLRVASECPPADIIAAFASGELPAAGASSVRAHISHCEPCLLTVGHLAAASQARSESPPGKSPLGEPSGMGAFLERGRIIGQYCLTRLLGEGGMGEVWEADQIAPVRRTVALKLLKAGMDTKQLVVRFEAERQVLALMQHPGIAQIFDAGIAPTGRPYFVMEFVDGLRITRHCDDAALGIRERLQLFQQVCDAVQHAHQKGVIHRDLKPSNVLVTAHNGRPLPKVIDFGLAKLTAVDLEEATLTEIGTVVGTPAYASPEQMSLGVIDVDTRSDVYSLGVLLYELLVGVLPFEPQGADQGALFELRKSIRDHEPTRPSGRFTALGESRGSQLASKRGTDRKGVQREIRGDLDWIVMKALEKDRARRYDSAGALAQDLQRYLDDEPVLAGSPSTSYLVRKFVARHRLGTAFAAVLAVLVIAFAAVSAVQLKRIAAERDRATAEAAKAASINTFLQDTLGSADPWQTGSDISVRESLKRAEQQIETSFAHQPLIAAAVRRTLGKTYIGLGRLDDAEREIRSALAVRTAALGPDHVDVAESLADLANLYVARADYDSADKINAQALQIRRRLLGNRHPLVAETLFDRSVLLKDRGEFDAAYQAAHEALSIREQVFGANSNEVAETLEWLAIIDASGRGDLAAGEQLVLRGYAIRRRLFGENDVRTAIAASNVGSVYLYAGKYEQAAAFYRRAMLGTLEHLGKSHPDTLVDMENLANALRRMGKFEESFALMKDVLAGRRAVLGDDNKLVIRTRVNLATLLSAWGRLTEAQAAFEEAVPPFVRAYGPEHPDTANALYAYGVLRLRQHEYAEAERLLRQALAIQVKVFPDDHPKIAETRLSLGETLTGLRELPQAEKLLVSARAALMKAYGADAKAAREASDALMRMHLEQTGRARP
jgi:eukaryotic-like serine/threonine-protein kinase